MRNLRAALDGTDDGGGILEPSSPLRAADPRSHTPVSFSLTHEGAPVTAKSNGRPQSTLFELST